jgi:predicted  nucleic acid-binding Zn-ribbon protein
MPQGKDPGIDWIAVRKRVEDGREPIAQIARELGIKPARLYSRKARWALQSQKASKPQKPQKPSKAPQTAKTRNKNCSDHASMVQRLYHAAEQQISHMESRLQTGEASFDEKEARMLGTIARTLDKLMELAKSSQQQEAQSHEQATNADLDALRSDLAKRLAHLQQ